MTSIGALVVFVNVPEIDVAPDPEAVPVIPTTEGADHEYVVPLGTMSVPFEGVTVKVPSEQIDVVVFAIVGVGFTVTSTWSVLTHPLGLVTVNVYVVVTGAFVLLLVTKATLFVTPLFHEYVDVPEAVNVTDSPIQMT